MVVGVVLLEVIGLNHYCLGSIVIIIATFAPPHGFPQPKLLSVDRIHSVVFVYLPTDVDGQLSW